LTDAICDEAEEADRQDIAIPEDWAQKMALVVDIDAAGDELQRDFLYPINPQGNVMMLQYMHPDVMPTLVYHLIRCGWRKDMDKRLVKQRQVIGSMYEDLVAYVDLDQPDDPIVVERPEIPENLSDSWSVRPQLNVIDEERK
jgi:hypothetical protein